MTPPQTFTVAVHNRTRPAVTRDDYETARTALAQVAAETGYRITTGPRVIADQYVASLGMYEAVYSATGRLVISPSIGSPDGNTAVMVLRAHRTPLHGFQVLTGAVETALTTRQPLAALVALHLLHMPVATNTALASASDAVTGIFQPRETR